MKISLEPFEVTVPILHQHQDGHLVDVGDRRTFLIRPRPLRPLPPEHLCEVKDK